MLGVFIVHVSNNMFCIFDCFRRNIATNTHAWRPHFWFCVIFLANYTNYTNKSNKHVFIIILLDVYLKVHLLRELPDVQYLSNPKCWCQAKKIPDVQDFLGYISCKNARVFGCFLRCKKARPKHTVLEGVFGTFLQKKLPDSCQNPWSLHLWPFYKSFFFVFFTM